MHISGIVIHVQSLAERANCSLTVAALFVSHKVSGMMDFAPNNRSRARKQAVCWGFLYSFQAAFRVKDTRQNFGRTTLASLVNGKRERDIGARDGMEHRAVARMRLQIVPA